MQRLLMIFYAVFFVTISCFASTGEDYSNFLVTAQIVSTNGIFEVRPLSFGVIVKGKDSQKVIISPKEKNKEGQSGKLIILGNKNQSFLAMLKKQNINMSSGDEFMKVNNFSLSSKGYKPAKILKGIINDYETELFIGATLIVPKDQKPGLYSGKNTIVIYMY